MSAQQQLCMVLQYNECPATIIYGFTV